MTFLIPDENLPEEDRTGISDNPFLHKGLTGTTPSRNGPDIESTGTRMVSDIETVISQYAD